MEKTNYPTHGNYKRGMEYENKNVAVAQAGLTTVAELQTGGLERAFVQISVAGQALDQFVISGKASKDAPWSTLYATADDYAVPQGIVLGLSGDLTVLPAGQTGNVLLDVRGFFSIKLEASSANAAGSTVSVFGGAE